MVIRRHPLGVGSVVLVVLSLVAAGLWLGRETASAATPGPDKIVYSQQNGKNGTYLQYVPGDGSKATTQAVTGAGGCATPNTTNPVLAFSANYYANGYAGTSTPAIVGAYNGRTGVCQIAQAWSIDVNEGLVFAPGANALTTGRQFSSAVLILERNDKTGGTLSGQLVERVAGVQVGTTPFTITGASGTTKTIDTGLVKSGFDSIEVQVNSPSAASLSLVGPLSTFTFGNKLCPGDSITTTSTGGTQTSGEVTATFNFVAGSACKTYTFFGASSTEPTSTNGKYVNLVSTQLAGAHMTATFDWGNFDYCRADATVDPNVPPCPTTWVEFGDGVYHPQTYCAAADPNNTTTPWCTKTRNVDYRTVTYIDPNTQLSVTKTVAHITETWDGWGDIGFKYR